MTPPNVPRLVRAVAAALAVLGAMSLGGCRLLALNKENAQYSAATVLAGRISAGSWQGPVGVAAIRHERGRWIVQHDVWLHEVSGFDLVVPDGEYSLVAFGDRDNDGSPDPDAPAGIYPGTVKVAGGGLMPGLNITLQPDAARRVHLMMPLEYQRAARFSTAPGALADLAAPEFSAESGMRGYWAPMEYFRTLGGNVYFVEPYDPARTPVLFVHGATGSAQDFRYFIEHLDRTRYQAWIYQYPSGAPLAAMSNLLYWKLLNLQLRYGYTQLDLVAHSMGGLVARRFLLDHAADLPQIRQFVSISTPWGGQRSAALGVIHSPAVIPSWRDLQPEGPYLNSLFARPLPEGINYTLLFGQLGGEGLVSDASEATDGTILVSSQLRAEAERDAALVMGFDESHVGILSSPKVVSEVQRVFAAVNDTKPGGRLNLEVRLPTGAPEPAGISTLLLRRLDGDDAGAEDFTLAVTAMQAGAKLGPVPPGDYEVRLAAAPFRALPDRQRLHLDAGGVASIRFNLQPDGVLLGEVVAQSDRVHRPAGSYQRAETAIQADVIRLSGPVTRELIPQPAARGALLEAYLDGRDAATNQMFCFLGLPSGDYVLTVHAGGYEPSTSTIHVEPGRHTAMPPIVMRPDETH